MRRWMDWKRWISCLMAAVMFFAPVASTAFAETKIFTRDLIVTGEETETTEDFLDKWVLNGGSIGSAAGAILGQVLGSVLFPGPIGWVVGSTLGGFLGGIVGTLIDNKIHKAYNYASFDRPPIDDGGLFLEGAGFWEQTLYQIDQWVISGGTVGSLVGHFGANMLGAVLPGGVGAFLSSIGGVFLINLLFGTIGDNLDGLIDMGKIGERVDDVREERRLAAEAEVRPSESPAAPASSEDRREAYQRYLDLMRMGEGQSAEAREAFERYQAAGP